MKQRAIVPLVLIFIALIALPRVQTGNPLEYSRARTRLVRLFTSQGAERGYQEFVRMYEPFQTAAHNVAHIAGELLYEHEGLRGISFCDASFVYGCYHGFFGRAIATQGSEVVGELGSLCDGLDPLGLSGCFHGVGHGIAAVNEYTNEALGSSLAMCEKLAGEQAQQSCANGVFMEYNTQLMRDQGQHGIRTFSLDERFSPCQSIGNRHREACFFELPLWWQETGQAYEDMMKWCEEVSGDAGLSCARGIGRAVSITGGDKQVQSICLGFSSQTERQACWEAALVYRVGRDGAPGVSLCQVLSGEEQELCITYGNRVSCQLHDDCNPGL